MELPIADVSKEVVAARTGHTLKGKNFQSLTIFLDAA
jgi:hypothetical protein